jgi:hypothetical protein
MVALQKKSGALWSRIGLCFSAVEVMDGYSAEWGASSGDIIAMLLEQLCMFHKN